MKSAEELSNDLDAIKVALKDRALSIAEINELESEIAKLKEILTPELKTKHSILELEGLGKEIWQGIDVDEYIRQERRSWR